MSATFADPIQQEIWTTLRAMNDAWIRGNPDDLVHYFHRGMIAIIPGERNRLESGAACVAGWKAFAEAAQIHHWEEKNPVIRVYGSAAVVAYEYAMSFDMGGRTIDSQGRDMFFFVKEDGRWQAVADQFSPVPASS
ncbi:MAG: DUF4440 domain-containing protein [bacterium]